MLLLLIRLSRSFAAHGGLGPCGHQKSNPLHAPNSNQRRFEAIGKHRCRLRRIPLAPTDTIDLQVGIVRVVQLWL